MGPQLVKRLRIDKQDNAPCCRQTERRQRRQRRLLELAQSTLHFVEQALPRYRELLFERTHDGVLLTEAIQRRIAAVGDDERQRVAGAAVADHLAEGMHVGAEVTVCAAEDAVRCIREGLDEPSSIMPFQEPHLPFYDPIRHEPVFVELVDDLANWQDPTYP